MGENETSPGPASRQPVTVTPLVRLALGADLPAIDGKELRLQITRYDPGRLGTPHGHAHKLEVVYVLSGTITEHHADGAVQRHGPGAAFSADGTTLHHLENTGDEPVELLVAMIVDAQP